MALMPVAPRPATSTLTSYVPWAGDGGGTEREQHVHTLAAQGSAAAWRARVGAARQERNTDTHARTTARLQHTSSFLHPTPLHTDKQVQDPPPLGGHTSYV